MIAAMRCNVVVELLAFAVLAVPDDDDVVLLEDDPLAGQVPVV